ncbi:MAG: hypothetical protein ACRDL1_07030 [Solirubrobacterales bacterium]
MFELLVAAIAAGAVIGLIALWPGDVGAPVSEGLAAETERAEVISVTYEACPPPQTGESGEAEIRLDTGPESGGTLTLISGGTGIEPELEPGYEIRVARTEPAPVGPPTPASPKRRAKVGPPTPWRTSSAAGRCCGSRWPSLRS